MKYRWERDEMIGEHTGMERIEIKSKDIRDIYVEKIGQILPEVLTEQRDVGGQLKQSIDFEKLRECLGEKCINLADKYEFSWVGKHEAIVEAGRATAKTLRPNLEDSFDFDSTKNIFISGDNLDVLRILQESYLNKVDVVYIDPPYNTGNDFVYSDKFQMSDEELKRGMNLINEDGWNVIGLTKNEKYSARFHSDWLSMIYPRLRLARNLLKDSGVIFISIGEMEQAHLKEICNEIFGEANFICNFVVEKTQHFGRQKLNSYNNVDYILCYAKELIDENSQLKELLVEFVKEEFEDAPLYNKSNNENVIHFPKGTVKFNLKDGYYSESTDSKYLLLDEVEVKDGINNNSFRLKFRSRWSNETVQNEISKGTRFWVKTQNFAIRAIYSEGKKSTEAPKQIIFTNQKNPTATKSRFNQRIDTFENATTELEDLIGEGMFSYPKPVSLIKYLLSLVFVDNEHLKEALVLDFFAGSATTAEAVLQLNSEEGVDWRYILCTLDEEVAENSTARKNGFGTIDQIARERIYRAAEKINLESPNCEETQDLGFKVFRVDSSNYKSVAATPSETTQSNLFDSVSNIKSDRTPLDLLYQVILSWGIELSIKVESMQVESNMVYNVGDGLLLACFDEAISESTIRQMAAQQPSMATFRDDAFGRSADKINLGEIFKEFSPETKVKVI